MKKFTEFLETIFSTANQRIKSPFFGSFIFSWILINWKPIFYFLFSDDKIKIKIENIESSYEFIQNAILYPLFLSFTYVVVFPYVNQFIHWLTIKAEKSKRVQIHNLRKEQIENSKDLAKEEKKLEDIRSGNRDISQLNEKIELLSKENIKLKESIQQKEKTVFEIQEKLLENQKDNEKRISELIDKNLEEHDKQFNIDFFVAYHNFKQKKLSSEFTEIVDDIYTNNGKMSKIDNRTIQFFLDEYIIKRDEDGSFDLTSKGRNFWKLYQDIR